MPPERPIFSESWYRVVNLRPRLRAGVQVRGQFFRGQKWHIVQDPHSNQYSRLSEPGYYFVALLDGRQTVGEVWEMANAKLGDNSPTQGETIELLGQLYSSNLLQADLPPDAEGLLSRYRRRKVREAQSYFSNLLFLRIPLLDPDRFLDAILPVFGWLFSWVGAALLAVLVATGLYFLAGRWIDLTAQGRQMLDPARLPGVLPLLYAGLVLVKVFHELGHSLACKKFGRQEGAGGEVHVIGVMMLVFTPMPYMDASSAWWLRSKWRRIVVGAAGMLVEFGVAAVAAVVWANTSEAGSGTSAGVHAVAYNIMLIASVSTILFNGNPLLRYDAYYILSDLLEIPNLAQRSREYLYYLVKRYVWGLRQARNPAHGEGEKVWFVLYGIASTIYRFVIVVGILLFIADKFLVVGAVLAVAAMIAWFLVPASKFAHYLLTGGELNRKRGRAIVTTLITLAVPIAAIAGIPVPDHYRVEGVVEPIHVRWIHLPASGVIHRVAPSEARVAPADSVLVAAENRELQARLESLEAQRRGLLIRARLAEAQEFAMSQILREQVGILDEQIAWVRDQLFQLEIRAPFEGIWVCPDAPERIGLFVRPEDRLGMVMTPDDLIVRAVAGQDIGPVLFSESCRNVEIRVKGRPDMCFSARILKVLPAGQQSLPSAALGYAVGGSTPISPDDRKGTQAAEPFFEIHLAPDAGAMHMLRSGQLVVVRLEMSPKPLAVQGWRSILQLIQRRFHI